MTNLMLMFIFISVLKANLQSNNSLYFRHTKKNRLGKHTSRIIKKIYMMIRSFISSPHLKNYLNVLEIGFKLTGCVTGYHIVLTIIVIYDCYRSIKWFEITFNKFHHRK